MDQKVYKIVTDKDSIINSETIKIKHITFKSPYLKMAAQAKYFTWEAQSHRNLPEDGEATSRQHTLKRTSANS